MNDPVSLEVQQPSSTVESVQKKIAQIWKRARSNAFAHRCAADEYRGLAVKHFKWQVRAGILGILFVLAAYISTTLTPVDISVDSSSNWIQEFGPLCFTILSVISAALGLYIGIIQNYNGYEKLAMEHNHNHHSYLYIAQRAREVEWPDIDLDKAIAVLEDLERDFQVLKVRGQEPSDSHFNKGNDILYRIASKKESEMQSFRVQSGDSGEDANRPN